MRTSPGFYILGAKPNIDGYLILGKKARDRQPIREHVLVAEREIQNGPLPAGSIVHHKDGDKVNNIRENLQILPSQSDHQNAHRRLNAFKASGHWDWLVCRICGKYDDPKNLKVGRYLSPVNHEKCSADYQRAYQVKNKEAISERKKRKRMEALI